MAKKREYLYIAQARLTNARTGAITERGAEHDVSHLTDAQLQRALDGGALLRLPKPFVKDKTDADNAAQSED